MIGFEDLNIISWNVRGALHENGRLFVRDLIRAQKVDMVLLFETRCQFAQVSRFWSTLGFAPKFIQEAQGFSGGIWVLIRTIANFSCRLLHMHNQAVSFEIWRDNLSWACSAIYASPIPTQRENLWEHLCHIRGSITIPWLLVGDMNETLLPSEVRGGEFMARRAAKFAEVLAQCNLVDLGLVGGRYTWFRKRNNRIILSKKLDRGLGDVDWRMAFPEATIEILHRLHSDHCPLLVHCGNSSVVGEGTRLFRFMAAWADHPGYQQVVQGAWQREEGPIHSKLDRVRIASEKFNKETFGGIFRRKRWVEGRLRGVQLDLSMRVTSSMAQLESELQLEYKSILK
ncbi:uncharacterized protein LOC130712668 [Lotus japonicus]|uniref:uncharacterized protein LOC130712668 n=1 Tax=Lotus japonicus TaxID=34305 RepID=UPI00258AEB4A|nr:uncharacterized protein LOC130712668 [Lotus japonicus]